MNRWIDRQTDNPSTLLAHRRRQEVKALGAQLFKERKGEGKDREREGRNALCQVCYTYEKNNNKQQNNFLHLSQQCHLALVIWPALIFLKFLQILALVTCQFLDSDHFKYRAHVLGLAKHRILLSTSSTIRISSASLRYGLFKAGKLPNRLIHPDCACATLGLKIP